jgi:anti-sigma-K factor RskA
MSERAVRWRCNVVAAGAVAAVVVAVAAPPATRPQTSAFFAVRTITQVAH